MKGFIAIMLLLSIQAATSFSPNRTFRWKPKSDNLDITSSPAAKQSKGIDVQATSFPTNKSSGNIRDVCDFASQSTTTSFLSSIPTYEPLNITQRNVTILRVVTRETQPSQEPKEFKLCTYPERQLLGTDKRGIAIARKNPKKTTTFMIVQYEKDEFVLCAIRGRRRYIASLDGTTNGIQLHCTVKKEMKNEACKIEIKNMRRSEVTPYLVTLE